MSMCSDHLLKSVHSLMPFPHVAVAVDPFRTRQRSICRGDKSSPRQITVVVSVSYMYVKTNGATQRVLQQGGCALTLLAGTARQKGVLLDENGKEKREDSPSWRRRQGILWVTEVFSYSSEGWEIALIAGQCSTSQPLLYWQLRNALCFRHVQPFLVSSVYCVGLLSGPSVRKMRTFYPPCSTIS